MSSTDPEAASAASRPGPRISFDSLIVAASLTLAAGIAWAWLLRPASQAMEMANPDPLTTAYVLPSLAMWAIMMVAMMVPAATPMFLLHARIDRTADPWKRRLNSLLFVLAYFLVWSGFSLAAAILQALLVSAGALSTASLALGSETLAVAVLLLAAAYELTAAKRVCLDKCQAPLLFILRHWKPGPAGAFRLGLMHGLYCLGCCWMLMLILFVGGVMNLALIAILGIVVLGEKLAPPTWRANLFAAAALIACAMWFVVD